MSNIDRLVSLVHDALADEVYDGGSGALTEAELHKYTHTLARTAVEALTTVEMDGAEEFERQPNQAVATAGELATIWNAATPEHRQNMTDVIMARQDTALSCFMEDHEGAVEQVAILEAKLAEATAEPFCNECSGPYDRHSWPGQQYDGHWDTCPNRPNKGV